MTNVHNRAERPLDQRQQNGRNRERRTPANILLLIKSLGLGGAERLLVDSLPFLDRDRFHYQIAYLTPWKDTLAPHFVDAGMPIWSLGDWSLNKWRVAIGDRQSTNDRNQLEPGPTQVTPAHSLRAAAMTPVTLLRLRRLVQSQQIDLIHADMPVAGILARLVGRQMGVPVIYTEHNLIERYHPLTRWAHQATFGWQTHVLTVSDEVQASIQRMGGDRKTLVQTLLNGVPVEQVQREAIALEALRAELAIPADHLIVGTVAVFRSQKRLTDWLAVAANVAAVSPNVTFLLVGDGPEMATVQAQIVALGLTDRVRLPGFREDGRRYLALLDIYLMSSQFEGLPIALLEAMALGKPVVATNVGGIPEAVTHGQEGLLTTVGNIEELAAHLLALIADPEQRARFGGAGRARVDRSFHIRHRVAAIEALYSGILK